MADPGGFPALGSRERTARCVPPRRGLQGLVATPAIDAGPEMLRHTLAPTRPRRYRAGMKLTFLGTRAEIDARSRHRRHSVLEVTHLRRCVLIDCGRDWRTEIEKLAPHAIVLTHAHPDSCVRPARRGALSGACHARNVGWVDPLAAGVVRGGGRAAGDFHALRVRDRARRWTRAQRATSQIGVRAQPPGRIRVRWAGGCPGRR